MPMVAFDRDAFAFPSSAPRAVVLQEIERLRSERAGLRCEWYHDRALAHAWHHNRASMFSEFIGSGGSRRVFACALDPSLVLKIAVHLSANFLEEAMWRFAGPELRPWLAPIVWMSPDGLCIAQRRTVPIDDNDMPEQIPAILEPDSKSLNWGMLDGRPVSHDYEKGMTAMLRHAGLNLNPSRHQMLAPFGSQHRVEMAHL